MSFELTPEQLEALKGALLASGVTLIADLTVEAVNPVADALQAEMELQRVVLSNYGNLLNARAQVFAANPADPRLKALEGAVMALAAGWSQLPQALPELVDPKAQVAQPAALETAAIETEEVNS